MAPSKMAKGVQEFLDWFMEQYGEVELSQEDAEKLCGRSTASLVKDLTQSQLLQFALLMSRHEIESLLTYTDQLEAEVQRLLAIIGQSATKNRASRRATLRK
jgi:hypothetical protein